MERIERVKRRDGAEPVRPALLSPLERERQREERERRRRARERSSSAKPAGPSAEADPHAGPPRLDIRA